MSDFTTLINNYIWNKRSKKLHKEIALRNEKRKNILRYHPNDIENFIESDSFLGSYLISGRNSDKNHNVANSIFREYISKDIPVIIVHEENKSFQNALISNFTSQKYSVVINNGSQNYDPFYNRTNAQILNLVLNSLQMHHRVNPIGQQYLNGLSDFIRSKNILPYCEMYIWCPHDLIYEKLDMAYNEGLINIDSYTKIRNQLMQGQSEKDSIQLIFSELYQQANRFLVDKNSRKIATNIRDVVKKRGIGIVDIQSSTNESLLNLIVNEINELLSEGHKIMLFLDNVTIKSSDSLERLLLSFPRNFFTTLVSDDLYFMIGADDKLFNSLISNSNMCIIYQHFNSISCNKWSEVIGLFDEEIVVRNIGKNSSNASNIDVNTANSLSLTTNRSFIVKPEEISNMQFNEVYILDKISGKLIHTHQR